MFTILIPVLKKGYLESQLYWLSKQTYKDFHVLVMDAHYRVHKAAPFMQRKYPFPLNHVPLVHNRLLAKRFDNSILNNMALLAPTFHFIFLSDTSCPQPGFAEAVAHMIHCHSVGKFFSYEIPVSAYDRNNHTIKIPTGAHTRDNSYVTCITDKSEFVYVLNGLDEATTCAYSVNDVLPADAAATSGVNHLELLYHFDMPYSPVAIEGWRDPCDKCNSIFSITALRAAADADDFLRRCPERDVAEQMTYFEPEIEAMMFQCPNCGFGGVLSPSEYRVRNHQCNVISAPVGLLDGRAGRNLTTIYETMTRKVSNSLDAKLAFLRSSY